MRKGFSAVELLLVVVIVGIFGLGVYGYVNRFVVDYKCVRNGYVHASKNGFNKFCTKVVNGNTIVIHVDSIGGKN
jgi:prepilin-type N-terminal cleavage/methylation domain-containing protein